jgi:two-component system sensor histidine kinase RegB
VIATEIEREMAPNSPHADDVKLLREQAQRCRGILAKLTQLSASSEPFDRTPLSALIEETVAPHRNFGVAINVALTPHDAAEPVGRRNPVILYGLGNLLENAVDFARAQVDVTAEWSSEEMALTINDDGPGFAPEIMDRIGEPYVTGRRHLQQGVDVEAGGLGLGLFIAKTLLERSGAKLVFANRASPLQGASVRVRWARADFEEVPAPAA